MDVKRLVPPLLLVLGGLVSAIGAAGAVEQGAAVRHGLEVETVEGKVRVRLVVENHGDTTIYVPREVAAEDELTGPRFALRDAAGKPLAYTGMMVKRSALTAEDYQPVKPHTMHMNTIDITSTYAFKKGKNSYEIGYDGPWLADVGKLDEISRSPAAPVRFCFTMR